MLLFPRCIVFDELASLYDSSIHKIIMQRSSFFMVNFGAQSHTMKPDNPKAQDALLIVTFTYGLVGLQ